ncbi:MAG: hypothetical protein CVU48_04425 [Candidatus Cloacimonetes bacterium HGW-Cloacimonetes-1]|jgi:PBP1b-binding outer membrane lipoprotein LpoB|nr:MAG: hypothetical protein CVU48_04425 [Candidatus Cloacimonetes bacterium HGW-Cloacimonetes-1]
MKISKLALMIALVVLILSGCKGKQDTQNLPENETTKQITTFAPLPSFKEVFRALDMVESKNIAQAVNKQVFSTKQDISRNSFALGLLTADAIVASRSHNKKVMIDISNEMMKLTPLLGLDEEINRLGDDIKTMIDKEKWEDMEKALDAQKDQVEAKLWESESYDNYTLMLLGGWTEAINRVSYLIDSNYSADKTKVLNQKGTWNSLMANLDLINSEVITKASHFENAKVKVKEIKSIIDADNAGTYTQEQLKQLISLTDNIKTNFQK